MIFNVVIFNVEDSTFTNHLHARYSPLLTGDFGPPNISFYLQANPWVNKTGPSVNSYSQFLKISILIANF